jgi:hypothetical protein
MCVDVIQNRVSHDALSKLTLNINNIYLPKVVVEDYFVPALNTMCEKQNIPDDVAGATFMAAGASAPEMFAAFLSLFVTHSAIGVGTILGSELFNHLIITAGSIFYANEGTIQTEPRFVGRECMCVVTFHIRLYLFILFFFFPLLFSHCSVSFPFPFVLTPQSINQPTAFFYALALGMLVFALQDNSDSQDCYNQLSKDQRTLIAKGDVDGYICVPWWKSLLLVLAYGVYAAVCGYYQKLIVLFCPFQKSKLKRTMSVKESLKSFSLKPGELYPFAQDCLDDINRKDNDDGKNEGGDDEDDESDLPPPVIVQKIAVTGGVPRKGIMKSNTSRPDRGIELTSSASSSSSSSSLSAAAAASSATVTSSSGSQGASQDGSSNISSPPLSSSSSNPISPQPSPLVRKPLAKAPKKKLKFKLEGDENGSTSASITGDSKASSSSSSVSSAFAPIETTASNQNTAGLKERPKLSDSPSFKFEDEDNEIEEAKVDGNDEDDFENFE